MSAIGQRIGKDGARQLVVFSVTDPAPTNSVTFKTPENIALEIISVNATFQGSAVVGVRTPLLDFVWRNQEIGLLSSPISYTAGDSLEVTWMCGLGQVVSDVGLVAVPMGDLVLPPATNVRIDVSNMLAGDQIGAFVITGWAVPIE